MMMNEYVAMSKFYNIYKTIYISVKCKYPYCIVNSLGRSLTVALLSASYCQCQRAFFRRTEST